MTGSSQSCLVHQNLINMDHQLTVTAAAVMDRFALMVTRPGQQTGQRTPVHVVLVLDKSGSMAGLGIAAAKEATISFIELLLASKGHLGWHQTRNVQHWNRHAKSVKPSYCGN
jgi:hypothetical protein